MQEQERMSLFAVQMAEWFARHKRVLPWRDLAVPDETERAYLILVSEVMLQQTQVSRVQILYKRFLEQFPTIRDLAVASNRDVIIAWRGLGYNSRALRLRDAAKIVVEQHGGVFPQSMEELLAIKGIGTYTAGAIRNFAFRLATPCLDTNIRRILHRMFVGPESSEGEWRKNDRELLPVAEQTLDLALKTEGIGNGAEWHAALMDFGSLVCTKRLPKCEICPLNAICKSTLKVPLAVRGAQKLKEKKEPGRMIAGTYVPNRIIRGRIVECLRDAHHGLTLEEIGPEVCIDWNPEEHLPWLQLLIKKLIQDAMIETESDTYHLAS